MYPQRVTQAYFRVRRQALPGRKGRRPAYCRLTPSRSLSREVNIMTNRSSIHFAKCRPGGQPERHNFRQYSSDDFRPSYFLDPADQQPNTYRDLLEPDSTSTANAAQAEKHARGFFDDMKSHYQGRGKRAKYENCRREAILNLSESSTETDVMNVVKYLHDRWHLTCTSYAIHRDEGYKDEDGTVHRNLHAHLVLDSLYLDEKSGKPREAWRQIKIGDLRTIQDDIAQIMRMERTRGTGRARAHLDRETWKTVKIQQDAAEHQRRQAEAAAAKAETLTAQATAAAKAAALETEKAAKAKAEAEKARQEADTARQAAVMQQLQVRRDIENHRLQPSGIFVNRELRQANQDQADIIEQLQRKADATAANHREEMIKKDEQIRVMHEASEDRRQTIRQLRQQIAERDETIRYQDATIEAQQAAITRYEHLANTMYDVLEVMFRAVPQKIKDTVTTMLQAINIPGIRDLWDRARDHKAREAEAVRLEREQAAREAAERQAEEARRNRGRGYGR